MPKRRTLGKAAAIIFMMILTSTLETETYTYAYAPQPVSWRSRSRPTSTATAPLFGVRSTLKRKWVSGRSRILKHFGTPLPSSSTKSSPASLSQSSGAEPYAKFKVATTSNKYSDSDSQSPAVGSLLLERPSFGSSNLMVMQQQQQQEATFMERAPRHLVLDETSSANIQRAKSAALLSDFSDSAKGEPAKSAAAAGKVVQRNERDLSKLAREFYSMVHDFAAYTEADILSIADPRKRAVVDGVVANANSPPIYRAFEILFEDLLPLRLAGRLIFARLREFMAESIRQRESDVQTVLNVTGLMDKDEREIQEIRLMFVSTASQLNHDSYLTLEQLKETGMITSTATHVLGFDTVDQLLERLDTEKTGKLNFVQLMVGLWTCANDICGLERCNPRVVLHNLIVELDENLPSLTAGAEHLQRGSSVENSSDKTERFARRYNEMVASFIEWKDLLPPHGDDSVESRPMQVVRGCFVGAENEKVVDALRICYVEYTGLRIAGDVIFKLASSVLNKIRANQQQHHTNSDNGNNR